MKNHNNNNKCIIIIKIIFFAVIKYKLTSDGNVNN